MLCAHKCWEGKEKKRERKKKSKEKGHLKYNVTNKQQFCNVFTLFFILVFINFCFFIRGGGQTGRERKKEKK